MASRSKFRNIQLSVGVVLLTYIILISIYVVNFRHSPFSNKPSDWNDTSGYFGNISSILFSIAGIIISGYIAFEIQKFADTNSSKEINVQKTIAKISFQKEELDIFGNRILKIFENYHSAASPFLYGSDGPSVDAEVDEKLVKDELYKLRNEVLRAYRDLITRSASIFVFSEEFDNEWADRNLSSAILALDTKEYLDVIMFVTDVRVGFGHLLNSLRHQMINQLTD